MGCTITLSVKVRHDGEILELRQRCEIEKSIMVKEGDREVVQVRCRARFSGLCELEREEAFRALAFTELHSIETNRCFFVLR